MKYIECTSFELSTALNDAALRGVLEADEPAVLAHSTVTFFNERDTGHCIGKLVARETGEKKYYLCIGQEPAV